MRQALYSNVFGLAWAGDEVWFTAADELPLFRNTIYAMNRSGDVRLVARVPGNASLHDIAVRLERPGLTLLAARWLPDERNVVVPARTENGEARLYVLDVEGGAVRQVTPDGFGVGETGWAVSPDGAMVAVSGGPQLELLRIADGAARAGGLGPLARGWLDRARSIDVGGSCGRWHGVARRSGDGPARRLGGHQAAGSGGNGLAKLLS